MPQNMSNAAQYGRNIPETAIVRQKTKRHIFRNIILILLALLCISLLLAALVLPIFTVTGETMMPALSPGDVVVAVPRLPHERGEVIALNHRNKLLIRRIVGLPGDTIDLDEQGTVQVGGLPLNEPYVAAFSPGQIEVDLPCEVPDGKYFILADERTSAADSRSAEIGCIGAEQIVGRVALRVWPPNRIGLVK